MSSTHEIPAQDLHRTRRLDLISSLLSGGFLAVIEMGPALAKKGYGASDLEVALLTSGQSLGLIASFFVAHFAFRSPKMPLVFWPEVLGRIAVVLALFIRPDAALLFVMLHCLAQLFQNLTTPARVTILNLNYPASRRGRIVGRIRQLQLVIIVLVALLMAFLLDWKDGGGRLEGLLGRGHFPANLLGYLLAALGILGLAGTLVFRRIRVREEPTPEGLPATMGETYRRFRRVWREDPNFRRYENFFFLFGFANIMSIPLTQIHAVDNLHADWFDLTLINVVLVQGMMALTMAFWGRQLDKFNPSFLRGILNVIFSVDFLVLAVAPTIGWVYLGRLFRGIALGGGTLVWMLGSLYYARSKEDAPIYLGIHTVLTGFRWLTAPFVGVVLKKYCAGSARPIFLLSFGLILTAAVLMLRGSKREPRRKGLEEETMPAPRSTGA